MKTTHIQTHESPFTTGEVQAGVLDFPRDGDLQLEKNIMFAGWVLREKEDGAPLQLRLETDQGDHTLELNTDRPDVISAVLKKDSDARLCCGFRMSVPSFQEGQLYIVTKGEKTLWREVSCPPLSALDLLNRLAQDNNGFACSFVTLPPNDQQDPKEEAPAWVKATLKTFKGFKHTHDRPPTTRWRSGPLSRRATPDQPLPTGTLETGDLYQVVYDYADGTRIITKGCFGARADLLRAFTVFEIPRDDLSLLKRPTEDLLQSGTDLINLKKLIIRLRRAKRAFGERGVFSGVHHDHIESDLLALKEMYSGYFSTLNQVIDVRYIWSIVDCIADFGTPIERACALSVSNFMHAERMAQSLRNVYDFADRCDPVLTHQLPYWGGMKTNQYSSDDALDIFLTRIVEIVSEEPFVFACFGAIMLEAANHESSLLGENLRRSRHFQEAFEHYADVFRRHIADMDKSPI